VQHRGRFWAERTPKKLKTAIIQEAAARPGRECVRQGTHVWHVTHPRSFPIPARRRATRTTVGAYMHDLVHPLRTIARTAIRNKTLNAGDQSNC